MSTRGDLSSICFVRGPVKQMPACMDGTGCMEHPRETQLHGKRNRCVTSASIFSAPSNIELSGNKELGLCFRVIPAWLVGVKVSAAADLRKETAYFRDQSWKVIQLGWWDSAGTAAVSSSCTQDGG